MTPPEESPTGSRAPQRILVVDDNHDAADTLSLLLEFLGYQVRTAYDGAQAVDVAAGFEPHLVILDIHMPVMDGYEAAKVLRRREGEKQRTVLVALTAVATPDAQRKAREAGFDIHLRKPVDGGELAGLLERVLH